MAVLTDCFSDLLSGQSVNVSQSDIVHPLGQPARDKFGREWIYCRANNAITGQGYVVALDTSYDATLLTGAIADTFSLYFAVTGTNGAPADNDYLWACTAKPPGDTELGVWTLPNCTPDTQLYTSATAGALDDDASSQSPVDNVRLLTATGGSAAANTASEWRNMRRGHLGT